MQTEHEHEKGQMTMPGLPDVMSKEWLSTLQPGDQFEIEGLFQGVTKVPVTWHLRTIQDNKKYNFEARYMDVHLANYLATVTKAGEVVIKEIEESQ